MTKVRYSKKTLEIKLYRRSSDVYRNKTQVKKHNEENTLVDLKGFWKLDSTEKY